MHRKPFPPRLLLILTTAGLVLLIALGVILAVAAILFEMDDLTGARVLHAVALACAIVLVVDLLCLVLSVGVNAASEPVDLQDPDEKGE